MARILAVDDQLVMRELVKQVLENAGHEVFLADNPQPAMEIAKVESLDLIITDINMPGGSGLNLVDALRKESNTQFTPILMMTTETAEHKKDRARKNGASGWLGKPFDPPRLLAAVQKLTSS
ncbi:MAG: response regulator [Cellvibrionaceae bacterium]